MDRTLALFAIGLVFGCGIGFVVAAGNAITFEGHDHGNPAQHAGTDSSDNGPATAHDMPLEVAKADAPRVDVALTPDPTTGYNLHIVTERFTFVPEAAGRDHVPGQGHAHVYVNGVKLGRYYGPWVHMDALRPGDVEVTATLNANDHRPYAVGGTPVRATTRLTVE